jgi:ketosteroid isomerase-like protein
VIGAEANFEIVRAVLRAIGDQDVETLAELCAVDFEFVPILAALEGRTYRGHDDMRRWIDELADQWEVFEPSAEEFHDLGNEVLALGGWQAKARGTGTELPYRPAAWVARIEDSKVVSWRAYTDPSDALEAIGGLPEEPGRRT